MRGNLTTRNIGTTEISEANTPAGNDFLPWSEGEIMSDGYSGDEEWENQPPAATYCERRENKKARERAAQWKRSEEMYWGGQKSKMETKRGRARVWFMKKLLIDSHFRGYPLHTVGTSISSISTI